MIDTPVTAVLRAVHAASPGLDVMLVGAWCRNLLHVELGHTDLLAATSDVDLALAVPTMEAYTDLVAHFPPTGTNQIRYVIAGVEVDLMPFGEVERPPGEVLPPPRDQPMNVWGFREVRARSRLVELDDGIHVHLPTPAGYGALKLAAWLDRREPKDARDIGTVVSWYDDSDAVTDRLLAEHPDIVEREDWDFRRGAAHVVGHDILEAIGQSRAEELRVRWTGDHLDVLARELGGGTAQLPRQRRRELVEALSRGLGAVT